MEAVGADAPVQLGDEVAGGGEHDRVKATVTVGQPCAEQLLGRGDGVANVDALPIEVEAESFRSAVTKDEGGSRLCLIIKPVQFGQPVSAVDGLEVTEHAASADRRKLLIIADQPDAAASLHNEVNGGVEGGVSAIPASSMITNVDSPTLEA